MSRRWTPGTSLPALLAGSRRTSRSPDPGWPACVALISNSSTFSRLNPSSTDVQIRERPHEQARRHEQQERDRDLRHHQCAAQAQPAEAGDDSRLGAVRTSLSAGIDVRAGRLQRRRQAEQHAAEHRQRRASRAARASSAPRCSVKLSGRWRAAASAHACPTRRGAHRPRRRARRAARSRSAAGGRHAQRPAPMLSRTAISRRAGGRSREQQVGRVRARERQDQADHRQQHVERLRVLRGGGCRGPPAPLEERSLGSWRARRCVLAVPGPIDERPAPSAACASSRLTPGRSRAIISTQ